MWAGRKYKERAGCGMEDAWGQQRSENSSRESWEKSESRQSREIRQSIETAVEREMQ